VGCWEGHEGIVALLLATGQVDAGSKSSYGQKPLWWAAENGHEAIVKKLLETDKVNIDTKDKAGRRPLFHTINNGDQELLKHLWEKGANTKCQLGIT
jgi:ankyrin repeat protein